MADAKPLNSHRNRATKSRRITDIAKSEELLLLALALHVVDIGFPGGVENDVSARSREVFLRCLAKYRQGMLVYDNVDLEDLPEEV